jgi:hypothetical protein
MWKIRVNRHLNDEELLRYQDRELKIDEWRRVEGHMAGCAHCQHRFAELEGQLTALERQLGGGIETAPERAEAAKQKFLAWAHNYEAGLENRKRRPQWFVLPSPLKLAGIGVIALVLLSVAIRWYWPPIPSAESMLAAVRKEEGRLLAPGVVVRQVYDVETLQLKPLKQVKRGRLEIVNNNSDGKYAVRWQSPEGQLQFALWHPTAGQAYTYDRLQQRAVAYQAEMPAIRRLSEVAEAGPELEQLENRLMRWLASRQWQPVRLGEEWAEFSSSPGVRLQVESLTTEIGDKRYRLTASRLRGGNLVTLVMEVGSEDYRPRLVVVRLEQGNRAVEVWLRAANGERLSSGQFQPSVFDPDVPLLGGNLEETRLIRKEPTNQSDLVSAEVEAFYALHRVKACLGEPFEVRVERAQVWVHGQVETTERRSEIEGALRKLPLVQSDIQLFPENISGETTLPINSSREIRMPEIQGGQWPWEEQLERYATQHPESLAGFPVKGTAREKLIEIANNSLNQAQAALTEAWALRRLAERFPHHKNVRLLPRSLWLLEIMVKDHEIELQKQITACRQTLEPLLQIMAQLEKNSGIELPAVAPVPNPLKDSTDWAAASLQVFSTAQRFQRKLSEALATATLRKERANDPRQILELLLAMETRCAQLATQTQKSFAYAKTQPEKQKISSSQPGKVRTKREKD